MIGNKCTIIIDRHCQVTYSSPLKNDSLIIKWQRFSSQIQYKAYNYSNYLRDNLFIYVTCYCSKWLTGAKQLLIKPHTNCNSLVTKQDFIFKSQSDNAFEKCNISVYFNSLLFLIYYKLKVQGWKLWWLTQYVNYIAWKNKSMYFIWS